MNNRACLFLQTLFFPCALYSKLSICHFTPTHPSRSLSISQPLFSPVLIIFPLFACRLEALLQAEIQLSVLSQSDRLGRTSGHPWQGGPPRPTARPPSSIAQFYRADRIEIWTELAFMPPEKTKSILNQNTEARSAFHLGACAGGNTCSCSGGFQHHSIYQLSVNRQLIQ